MNNDMFNELLASVEEMEQITQGNKVPSRQFQFAASTPNPSDTDHTFTAHHVPCNID